MSTLKQSEVSFVEDREAGKHEYWFGFQKLSGVTEILRQVLFYDKYDGIDAEILERAARRGTAIHETIQAYLMQQELTLDEDLADYQQEAERALQAWKVYEHGSELPSMIQPDCVEYLVSNEKDIASKVDVVFRHKSGERNQYVLADIKTTSEFDEEYLSWQLSIYADLFRQQTGEEVSMLLGMWYNRTRGTWQVIQIKDKGHDEVQKLLADWRSGMRREPVRVQPQYPQPMVDLGQMWRDMENELKRMQAERDGYRTRLMEMMKENGIKSVELEGFRATYIEPTERKTFDVKRLTEEHPELADIIGEYYKTSQVSETIKITI